MEKCLFLYNPLSGKGKIVKKEEKIVKDLSQKYEVEVCRSQHPGHIGELILEKGNDVDLIVVAGGDGTLNEAINSIMRLGKKVKLGYIPTGTVNDVAHSLGIPRNIKKAVKNILEGEEFSHDVFKMNDRYGIYVCCSGLFTETSYATDQKQKRKMGKVAYAFHGIKKVFSTPAVKLKLSYDGGELEGKYALMLVLNSKSVAGFRINRRAALNDGLVDVVLIKSKKDKVNFGAVCKVAMFFLQGIKTHYKKNIDVLQIDKFRIDTTEDTIINLDGEKIGEGSFNFEVIKEGINIIVPSLKKLIKHEEKID